MSIFRAEYPMAIDEKEAILISKCKDVANHNARNMAIALCIVVVGAYFLGIKDGKKLK